MFTGIAQFKHIIHSNMFNRAIQYPACSRFIMHS